MAGDWGSGMNPEQARALEEIKEELATAAFALNNGNTSLCCNRLVDAFLLLCEYLENLSEE